MRRLFAFLAARFPVRQASAGARRALPVLPGARHVAPGPWRETDMMNLDAFLRTSSGRRFLLTLHDMAVSRALVPVERTAFENGVTGGFSVMVGEIERLACEGEPLSTESEET